MAEINLTKLSPEVKQKYQVRNNAFIQTVKDNWRDRLEVELGDTKDVSKFQPQVKIKRWDNEVNLSARLTDFTGYTIATEGEKIKLIGAKKEVHFYDIAPCEEHPEGGFETEVRLLEDLRPTKKGDYVIQFSVVDEGVQYFFQPPLNQEPLPLNGVSATETDVFDKDGKVIVHRPENVVGSYAVYAKSNKVNYVGGKEYKCGQVGFIYRPKIVDSAGMEVWGNLHIENGILSVTILQDFLDKAVYPVRHASGLLFGFDTKGGTQDAPGGNWFRGSLFTSPADVATGVSISLWTDYGTWKGLC